MPSFSLNSSLALIISALSLYSSSVFAEKESPDIAFILYQFESTTRSNPRASLAHSSAVLSDTTHFIGEKQLVGGPLNQFYSVKASDPSSASTCSKPYSS